MSIVNVIKIPAIAPQNETIMISSSVMSEYKQRFKSIYTLFDNDPAGITLAFRYLTKHTLSKMFIPYKYNCKDFSDLVKKYGAEFSKNILIKLCQRRSQ